MCESLPSDFQVKEHMHTDLCYLILIVNSEPDISTQMPKKKLLGKKKDFL